MTTEDTSPRRSTAVRAELRHWENRHGAELRKGRNDDALLAKVRADALRTELAEVVARETREAAAAKADAEAREAFREAHGADTVGEAIAQRMLTGEGRDRNTARQAARAAEIAESFLAPKPTTADLAAQALANAKDHARRAAERVEAQHNGEVITLADNGPTAA